MPNPKRRHSKARTSKRRAHDHLRRPNPTTCSNCQADKLPHRICPECGHYNDREVLEVETD